MLKGESEYQVPRELSFMKCIVCHESITSEEYSQWAEEFKPYPAHAECFDTFANTDEFLEFASKHVSSQKSSSQPTTPPPPPDLSPN